MTKIPNPKNELRIFARKKERGRNGGKWDGVDWLSPSKALNVFLCTTFAVVEYSLNLNGIYTESVAGSLCIVVTISHNCGFVSVCMG